MGKGDCGDLWGPENSKNGDFMVRSWDFASKCEKKVILMGCLPVLKSDLMKFNGDVMIFLQKKQVSFDGNLMDFNGDCFDGNSMVIAWDFHVKTVNVDVMGCR